MSKAELQIGSGNVEKTVEALDRLISQFEELASKLPKVTSATNNNNNTQKESITVLERQNIAMQKMIALTQLESKNLDKSSSKYAELKGEILAKEKAQLKGIKTGTKEYEQLVKTTQATEKASAAKRKLATRNKQLGNETAHLGKNMKSFTQSLDNTSKQVQIIDGPLGGVASRMTALSSIIKQTGSSMGLLLAGVGIATALIGREIAKGLGIAADAEVQLKTFEAQIIATGQSAGFTAESLDRMARSFALATLDNRKGVSDIISVMTSFRNVSGGAFREAISLSQDMGIALRQSPVSAARTLGKVLEDPLNNFKQLRRVGILFTSEEKDRIRIAQQQGDMYEAQAVIIEKLEGKFGGLAEAQADTLRGDIDTFGQLWEETAERVGKKLIPLSRKIVQTGVAWMELSQEIMESDNETTFRNWQKGLQETITDLEATEAQLEALKKQQEELGDVSGETTSLMHRSWLQIKDSLDWIPTFNMTGLFEVDSDDLTSNQQLSELLEMQIKHLQAQVEAQRNAKTGTAQLTEEQEKYFDTIKMQLEQQERLTKVFIETGDSRSEAYRKAKASIDAENAAKKIGLEYDKEYLKDIEDTLLKLSELTEARVKHNTVVQKEKALLSKQMSLQNEIELYELIKSGLNENEEAYLSHSAALLARQSVIQGNLDLGSEEHKQLEEQTKTLLDLQQQLKIVNALKSTDSNSSAFQQLEKELAIQELLTNGIRENSEEYYKQLAIINTNQQAKEAGIDLGTKEYDQLLAQNQALSDMEIKLQNLNNLKEIGIGFDEFGKAVVDGTRESIRKSADDMRGVLFELMINGDLDFSIYQDKIDELKTYFNDNLNALTIPLGIVIDEEGQEVLASSAEAIQVEMQEKLRELDQAWKAGLLQDEVTFAERRNEIMQEYDQKYIAAKQAAFEKSAEHLARIRQMEVAGNIQAGLENLAATKKQNSALAKAAKLMAMFKASTALVDSLSNASQVPWPANIAAYSQAFVQGTQLISMASSLNEPSFAFGGVDIQGKGTGRSDSIKANIARGESVMTAPATARHKETLKRMNAGLPVGKSTGASISAPATIIVQGDASENTLKLLDARLLQHEERVQQIASGISYQTVQEETDVGGLLNPI